MRRRHRALSLAVGIAALVVGASTLAYAAPMQPSTTPWEPFGEVEATGGMLTGPSRVAHLFLDENLFYGSHIEVSRVTTPPPIPKQDSRRLPAPSNRCASLDAEPCASASKVNVLFVLPACSAQRAKDCVEGIYTREDGVVSDATYVEEWVGQDSYQFGPIQTTSGPTMASGNLPLYRLEAAPHSGGSLYAASVSVELALQRQGAAWEAMKWDLGAQIMPVSKIPVADNASCREVGTRADNDQSCLDVSHVLPDQVMGLRVNVSPSFGSWIFGRVIEPKITIAKDGDSVSLDVEGRPSVVPMLSAVVDAASVTSDMYSGRAPSQGASVTNFTAGQRDSLTRWSAWNAASQSRADTLKRLWVYRSADGEFMGLATCVKEGEVAGWISTNAMVYEATPPVYTKATGALDFKIGGPAKQPDGVTDVSADYGLYLRDEVAACIWPGRKVVQVATVSVIDGASGEEVTSTSVGSSEGWTRFIARNVFFPQPVLPRARASTSNPTIRVVVPPTTDVYASCTLMRKKYKDGVSATGATNTVTVKGKKVARPALGSPLVSDDIYTANAKLDTDRDRLVCEREPKVR